MKSKKTMRHLTALIIPAVILVMAGCGSSSPGLNKDSAALYTADTAVAEEAAYDYGYYDDYEYDETVTAGSGFGGSNGEVEEIEVSESSAQSDRKLIRTVNLDIETYDFDKTTASVAAQAGALGGYIESSSVDGNTSSYRRSASYTLRIPASNADKFITTIGEASNITHQSESMEDVTLRYVDIKSRKESLQVEYGRLSELLAEAEDVEELIYIESRMSEVRYEIESIEAQLRSYDNLVDYTTIYLYVNEVQEYTEPEPIDNSIGARISRGLSGAFKNIGQFFQDLLVFVVVAIPYLIVIAILIVLVWLLIALIKNLARRYRLKHPKKYKKVPAHVPDPRVAANPYVGQPIGNTQVAPDMSDTPDKTNGDQDQIK